MIVISELFPKLHTVKILVRKLSKKLSVSEKALTVNMWKCLKYFQNLHQRSFMMFFHKSY